jgi:hypothetical protein
VENDKEPKSTGSSPLDIKALIAKSDIEVKFQRKESRAELIARLAQQDADAALQRAKELFLLRFVASVTIVCLIAPLLLRSRRHEESIFLDSGCHRRRRRVFHGAEEREVTGMAI